MVLKLIILARIYLAQYCAYSASSANGVHDEMLMCDICTSKGLQKQTRVGLTFYNILLEYYHAFENKVCFLDNSAFKRGTISLNNNLHVLQETAQYKILKRNRYRCSRCGRTWAISLNHYIACENKFEWNVLPQNTLKTSFQVELYWPIREHYSCLVGFGIVKCLN